MDEREGDPEVNRVERREKTSKEIGYGENWFLVSRSDGAFSFEAVSRTVRGK